MKHSQMAAQATATCQAFSPKEPANTADCRQVFWLPDQPRTTPSREPFHQNVAGSTVVMVVVVPGYSGGTATELHRFPYSSHAATRRVRHLSLHSTAIVPRRD